MSDRARQLAERINQYEDDRRQKEALQLHKATIFRAKVDDFWQKFVSTLKEEYSDFNETLREGSDYRIEHFSETRGQSLVKLSRGYRFASAKIALDTEARKITLTGEWEAERGGRKTLDKTVQLSVDDNDCIRLMDEESYVTESDVALEALKPFSLCEDA